MKPFRVFLYLMFEWWGLFEGGYVLMLDRFTNQGLHGFLQGLDAWVHGTLMQIQAGKFDDEDRYVENQYLALLVVRGWYLR